jgi:hypothetical protein
MSHVAKVLRDDISTISQKYTKDSIEGIGKSHEGVKKTLADLKRECSPLKSETKA